MGEQRFLQRLFCFFRVLTMYQKIAYSLEKDIEKFKKKKKVEVENF